MCREGLQELMHVKEKIKSNVLSKEGFLLFAVRKGGGEHLSVFRKKGGV
jgi:hypothetical protein